MHSEAPHPATDLLDLPEEPDVRVSVAATFNIASELDVPAFSRRTEYVPDIDATYQFDRDTTLAILAGFAHNRRVLIQGYHGTGKSTHIEQVAARLNWPCIRINLDSHISRIDLIGKDAIVLKDGKQITEYREGILPWSLQRPVALAFDEYDAGIEIIAVNLSRPDVPQPVIDEFQDVKRAEQDKHAAEDHALRPEPIHEAAAQWSTESVREQAERYC